MATEPAPSSRRLQLTAPGEKLLTSAGYNNAASLDYQAFHTFTTTGALKKELDAGVGEWATPNRAYALLKNAEMFWVDIRDERRFHTGCAVVKNMHYGDDVSRPNGYNEDQSTRVKERGMKNLKCEVSPGVTGTPLLKRYDTYGTIWSRRRYTLENDETYSFVQWMNSKALKLKEKPVATKLTDVAAQVKSLEATYRALKDDVAEMKTLLQNYSTLAEASLALAQSLKEIVKEQTTVNASLSDQISKVRSDLSSQMMSMRSDLREDVNQAAPI